MDLLFPMLEGISYNISLIFVLHQCNLSKPSGRVNLENPDVIVEEVEEDVFESETTKSWFWNHVKHLFKSGQDNHNDLADIDGGTNTQSSHQQDQCVKMVNFNHEQSINARAFLIASSLMLITALVCALLWMLSYYTVRFIHRVRKAQVGTPFLRDDVMENSDAVENWEQLLYPKSGIVDVSVQTSDDSDKLADSPSPINHQPLPLASFKVDSGNENISINRIDSACLLASTMDRFLIELDKALGISSDSVVGQAVNLNPTLTPSISAGAISSLASPRFPRRTWRRPRQGFSPSLPLGDASLMSDEQASKDRFAWNELERMNIKLGWASLKCEEIDFGHLANRNLSDILSFHIRNCPINTEQSLAASLMVNYIILLLEKELQQTTCHGPFRFIEFKGIGSVAKGLKISKANQFDVAMIIQPTNCTLLNVVYPNVSDDIPPGRLLLSVKDFKQDKKQKIYTRRASVGDSFGNYLLPREVHTLCKDLVNHGLQKLLNSNTNILTRLPFSIRIANEPDLQLILDTRMLHGLGLGVPEIGIRLCPALPLLTSTLTLLPTLYATTPWTPQRQSRRPSTANSMRIFRERTASLDPDLFWNLSFCDLESFYLSAIDQKFQLAGIDGCHRICLKIMKALFSSGYKTKLLSRGELDSYQIETVLFFLLLESAPCNWTLEKLSDRVSDSVHFLRSALQSTWLPSFFIHNPHLEKQIPAFQLYPLLAGGRQDNLMANMKTEAAEKILHFIDQRLEEVGLTRCIKEEFSTEMWEYEFFIFG